MTGGERTGRGLQDQVALVTGSSRGIGAAIAARFARASSESGSSALRSTGIVWRC